MEAMALAKKSRMKKQGQVQIQVTEDPHDKDPFRKKHKRTKHGGEEKRRKEQ